MDPAMSDPTRRDGDEQTSEQSPDPAQDDTVRMSRGELHGELTGELVDDLLARVSELRSDHEAADRERIELRKSRELAEREREQLRTERDLALRRAETAERRLTEVQARIHALEDSLRQRRGT
jgi:chromosome segregation ATPase